MRRYGLVHPIAAAALVAVLAPARVAIADGDRAPVEAPAEAERARELLRTIERGPGKAERQGAIEELVELAPRAVDTIIEFLDRERSSSNEERRALLRSIKAAVPDEQGRFLTPARQKAEEVRADDEFDWMAGLLELDPDTPGLGEVIADDAAIRALAASGEVRGGDAILKLAFSEQGIVYRDECGRYLRKMSPYSVPALIRGQHKRGSLARYAQYQLERLDREDPYKALAAAAEDERLTAAILDAYRETHSRQAVTAVLDHVDHISPLVRKAARKAWMAYVTGPPPPEAPKRKLQLPGGKLTEEEEPLWLTYRELAAVELARRHQELFDEKAPRRMDLEATSNKIFDYYDERRAGELAEVFDEGKALAAAGDHSGAVEHFDGILASHPKYERRAQMAPSYLEVARALEKDERWREASAAYAKAHALAPQGEHATDALAAYHYTLGRALESEGKAGGASYSRALELKPDYAPARRAAEASGEVAPSGGRQWMLYAGIGGGAGALLLLGLGLALRRR